MWDHGFSGGCRCGFFLRCLHLRRGHWRWSGRTDRRSNRCLGGQIFNHDLRRRLFGRGGVLLLRNNLCCGAVIGHYGVTDDIINLRVLWRRLRNRRRNCRCLRWCRCVTYSHVGCRRRRNRWRRRFWGGIRNIRLRCGRRWWWRHFAGRRRDRFGCWCCLRRFFCWWRWRW